MFYIDLTYLGDFTVRELWTSQVCYETFGHAFYLEDGIETGNVFEKNLVASIRPGGSLCSDWQVASGPRSNLQLGPSGFWITNPNNSCWHWFRGRFFLFVDVIGQVVFAGDQEGFRCDLAGCEPRPKKGSHHWEWLAEVNIVTKGQWTRLTKTCSDPGALRAGWELKSSKCHFRAVWTGEDCSRPLLVDYSIISNINVGVSFNGETYIIAGWFIIENPKHKWMI